MSDASLNVALVTEVFLDDPEGVRLRDMLSEAKRSGADIALLPELPLNEWVPQSKLARDEDAEDADGPRQQIMSAAASAVGIGLVGGAIVRDLRTGVRHNTALLYSASGECLARYRKIHLPQEEGFWETSHYEPGEAAPAVVRGLSLDVGLQICSDVNRPEGCQLLAAQGLEVVFAPRATPAQTYARWKLILRANAIMSGAYVMSVNRPRARLAEDEPSEPGADIGGPSLAIDPSGQLLAETTDRLDVIELRRDVVRAARAEYPGYLERFPGLYAEAWRSLVD